MLWLLLWPPPRAPQEDATGAQGREAVGGETQRRWDKEGYQLFEHAAAETGKGSSTSGTWMVAAKGMTTTSGPTGLRGQRREQYVSMARVLVDIETYKTPFRMGGDWNRTPDEASGSWAAGGRTIDFAMAAQRLAGQAAEGWNEEQTDEYFVEYAGNEDAIFQEKVGKCARWGQRSGGNPWRLKAARRTSYEHGRTLPTASVRAHKQMRGFRARVPMLPFGAPEVASATPGAAGAAAAGGGRLAALRASEGGSRGGGEELGVHLGLPRPTQA